MKKQHALMLIGGLLLMAFFLVLSIVFLTAPSPFSVIVDQDPTPSTVRRSTEGLIDINSADIGELMNLPGMTRETAVLIIEYRETYRRFNHAEELVKVEGIDKETIEEWKPYIYCK